MKSPRPSYARRLGWLSAVLVFLAISSHAGDGKNEIVAVFGTVHNGYKRGISPDGGYKPETYAFGEGGFKRPTLRDPSLEELDFMQVARVLARPLAEQNYVPGQGQEHPDLLIMVYWGATEGAAGQGNTFATSQAAGMDAYGKAIAQVGAAMQGNGAMGPIASQFEMPGEETTARRASAGQLETAMAIGALAEHRRTRENDYNSRLLGYAHDLSQYHPGNMILRTNTVYHDLLQEIEDDRYFVVLMAYDFKARARKETKLLWSARFSMPARGNKFDRDLEAMVRAASKQFGRRTQGLVRNSVPIGRVEMREIEILGVENPQ